MYQSVDLPVLDGAPTPSPSAASAAAAWGLFLRHGNAAYTLARMLSTEDEDAADVVEDVFVGIGRGGISGLDGADEIDEIDEIDDTGRRLAVLALVCRRLSAPPTDPCLRRVISILGEMEIGAGSAGIGVAADVTS